MYSLIRSIVNIIFFIIEALLLIRFILTFFGTNLAGSFASWIYTITATLIGPFRNIFPIVKLGSFSIDFTTLLAIIIYLIIGELIIQALYLLKDPGRRNGIKRY